MMERLSTGVRELDMMVEGGIPKGFFVALTGEPGTGKTVLCLHFTDQGLKEGDGCIYVTTEESGESILRQADQFGMNLRKGLGKELIMIDALMGEGDWSLRHLELDELIEKVVEAKKALGYGRARLIIDSMSAFWLDRPVMARRYSYYVKKVLSKWGLTILATSQYAISTSEAFGWGVEHIADGIIRFRRRIVNGMFKRFVIVEKMRQTNHDLFMHELEIAPNRGLKILGPIGMRREDERQFGLRR